MISAHNFQVSLGRGQEQHDGCLFDGCRLVIHGLSPLRLGSSVPAPAGR